MILNFLMILNESERNAWLLTEHRYRDDESEMSPIMDISIEHWLILRDQWVTQNQTDFQKFTTKVLNFERFRFLETLRFLKEI